MTTATHENVNEDPFSVLGLESTANAQDIRAAYLQAVKRHPPDRDPTGFERIREAYEKIQDPTRRIRQILMTAGPALPLTSLLDADTGRRKFTGSGPWLAALKQHESKE